MSTNNIRQELRLVDELAQSEHYDQAFAMLESLSTQDAREQALICQSRAYIHTRRGEPAAAIQCLNESVHRFSLEPHPYFIRGMLYLETGAYQNTIADCSKIIELCDFYQSDYYREAAYFLRADAYVRSGEFEKAMADCAQVADGFQIWTDRLRSKDQILAECK